MAVTSRVLLGIVLTPCCNEEFLKFTPPSVSTYHSWDEVMEDWERMRDRALSLYGPPVPQCRECRTMFQQIHPQTGIECIGGDTRPATMEEMSLVLTMHRTTSHVIPAPPNYKPPQGPPTRQIQPTETHT